jgi:hypothetical protein
LKRQELAARALKVKALHGLHDALIAFERAL